VDPEVGAALLRAIEADPDLEITVDVERRQVSAPAIGLEVSFPLDDGTRERFLEGLDDIGISLRSAQAIDDFEAARPDWLPSTG
jgi:3-isopropylmalate/(R)-2-methylmalate dehydratase small subunit